MDYKEEFIRARSMAYRILASRSRSEYELVEKLRHKGLDVEVIEKLVQFLKEYGMIDDCAYAREYIRFRMNNRPLGKAALSCKLRQKGIDPGIIDGLLAGIDPEEEYMRALALARGKKALQGETVSTRKVASFLWRRGFDSDTIYKVCHYLKDPTGHDIP